MQERWADIQEFPGFSVSTDGNVLNERTQRRLSQRTNAQGVVMVNLVKDHRLYTRSVALLVANAFLVNHDDPEIFNAIIHLDGDKSNNYIKNLMWRPRWFSIRYHRQFLRKPYKGAVYLTDTDEVFENIRDAAKKYGLLEADVFADLWNQTGVFPYAFIFLKHRE